MKILILKNKGIKDLEDKYIDVKEYFAEIAPKLFGIAPITFDIKYKDVDLDIINYIQYGGKNNNGKTFYTVARAKNEVKKIVKEGKYDAVMFFYKNPSWWRQLLLKANSYSAPNVSGIPLYKDTFWSEIPSVREPNAIKHEMVHLLFRYYNNTNIVNKIIIDTMDRTNGIPYLHNDDPKHPKGNYAVSLKTLDEAKKEMLEYEETSPITLEWYNENKHILINFSFKELEGFTREMCLKIQKARTYAGIPFHINDGYRNEAENKRVGGAKNSYHLKRIAIDIRAKGEITKLKIIIGLAKAGFTGIERGTVHIHGDLRPIPYYWVGKSK